MDSSILNLYKTVIKIQKNILDIINSEDSFTIENIDKLIEKRQQIVSKIVINPQKDLEEVKIFKEKIKNLESEIMEKIRSEIKLLNSEFNKHNLKKAKMVRYFRSIIDSHTTSRFSSNV